MTYFPVHLWCASGILYIGGAFASMAHDYDTRHGLDATAFILIMISIVVMAAVSTQEALRVKSEG